MNFLTALIALIASSATAHAATPVADFVPSGWKILATAEGDLNSDGANEVALALTSIDTHPADPEAACPRRLLILERHGDQLQRIAQNETMLLGCHDGGMFGDPFERIAIERGVLVIRHYGGSNWRWRLTTRIRWQDGAWTVIGVTRENTATIATNFLQSTDYNVHTGLVVMQRRPEAGGKIKEQRFYQLLAGIAPSPPTVDGRAAAGEWHGAAIHLSDVRQVQRGAENWMGANDASANIQAMVYGAQLYLLADVTDDVVTKDDTITLTGPSGRPIVPTQIAQLPHTNGYTVEAMYPLSALSVTPIAARDETMLPLSVNLIDVDAPKIVTTELSSATPLHGGVIRLTPYLGLPHLDTFVRDQWMNIAEE